VRACCARAQTHTAVWRRISCPASHCATLPTVVSRLTETMLLVVWSAADLSRSLERPSKPCRRPPDDFQLPAEQIPQGTELSSCPVRHERCHRVAAGPESTCARSAAAAWDASGMGGATAPTSLVSLGRVTIDASAERVRPCSERRLCSATSLSMATATLCFPLDSRCSDSRTQVLCGLLLPRAVKQAGRRLLAVRSVSWPAPWIPGHRTSPGGAQQTVRSQAAQRAAACRVPAAQVYKELAAARDWQPWLTAAKVVLPPGRPGALQPGDGFTYTAKFVPGFVSAKVGAAVDGQARARPGRPRARSGAACTPAGARLVPCAAQVLEWSDQVAFGLVKGAHIFRVEPQRRRRMLGLLSGPSQTRVFLSQEVAGARPPRLQRRPAAQPRPTLGTRCCTRVLAARARGAWPAARRRGRLLQLHVRRPDGARAARKAPRLHQTRRDPN